MLLKELIDQAADILQPSFPEREAKEMVYAYLEFSIGTKRYSHIIDPGRAVSDEAAHDALSAFRRMSQGEPLQYVTGKAYFYGREFNVTPDVLIPRPETEILCRTVIESNRSGRILDLCTGSGCIAWTLALEMPGTEVTAVDISEGALEVASRQDFSEEISRTGAAEPSFVKADALDEPVSESGMYDVIVSNPPYVMDSEKALMRSNVLDHEPHLALFVPDDDPLLFYRAVARWAQKLLKPDGAGIVEINEALGPETEDVFRSAGFKDVRTIKDLNEKDRFVMFSNVPR